MDNGYRGMGHMGNGITWGSRVWGTVGISHMGNGAHGVIGYRGYGVQDTWAMGTGGVGHMGQ